MSRTRSRANGEGSIFPYRNGYAAYAWVTIPAGERKRKYVYGQSRDEVHDKWLKLQSAARQGNLTTRSQTVEAYLRYWLAEVVTEPDYAPKTVATYSDHVRLYLVPGLGSRRLDKLTIREIRAWLNGLRAACQCCGQGKDAGRKAAMRRCCAIGQCCQQQLSETSVQDVFRTLRSALSNAVREELIVKNPARLIRLPKARKNRKVRPWSVEEAQQFLASARAGQDPMYAAYVLVLVLGLRKGEVLGLNWDLIDFDKGEMYISEQVQRVDGKLLVRQVKTEASEAALPLPAICIAALKSRKAQQQHDARTHEDRWSSSRDLVFTTRYGTPIEPRNLNRSFDNRIIKAGVRRIKLHGTRKTCGTLLAALDVHPRVAMQILRHSKIAVTMEIYTEATSSATRDALRRLGNELGPPASEGGDRPAP